MSIFFLHLVVSALNAFQKKQRKYNPYFFSLLTLSVVPMLLAENSEDVFQSIVYCHSFEALNDAFEVQFYQG